MNKMIWHLMQCHIIFLKIKMKENKNINKNIHHKSYIKVIIVEFTQDTRAVNNLGANEPLVRCA